MRSIVALFVSTLLLALLSSSNAIRVATRSAIFSKAHFACVNKCASQYPGYARQNVIGRIGCERACPAY